MVYTRVWDNELMFEYWVKDGVIVDKIKPIAWLAIRLAGRVISRLYDNPPVLTSGWRDVSGQLRAMQQMKRDDPNLYARVYTGIIKRRQDIATAPHPSGRAGDWRFLEFEEAEGPLTKIELMYMSGIKGIIGYVPSPLIVPEKDTIVVNGNKHERPRCLHIQIPPQIPDETKFKNYLYATFGRV
jgi:hypothetical protein